MRNNTKMFHNDDINLLKTDNVSDTHGQYLLKVGFEKTSIEGKYILGCIA